jgi:hypothetical protein
VPKNPWRHPFAEPPYVLPGDKEFVDAFNVKVGDGSRSYLHIDTLIPEPFIGDPQTPVLLLSNNPGVGKQTSLRLQPDFIERVRKNLRLEKSAYRFFYLDPNFAAKWWLRKLKSLVDKFGNEGREIVANSICNVVYFPYPSKRMGHRPPNLPSQEFGFSLVRAAIQRRAMIVAMRKGKLKWWYDRVEGLKGYENLVQLMNPRTPTVSPGNCEVGDFEKIVAAIERARAKKANPS